MRAPTCYRTAFGLYKATIRALEELEGCKRGWWFQNAVAHAESEDGLNDPTLANQLRALAGHAAPMTVSQLQVCN